MAERILVIGSPGSGKSTFTRRLGARAGLPVHHLDQLYWRAGWVEAELEAFRAEVEGMTRAQRWIIDGNYSGTLETRLSRADQVILLDLSPLRCTWRILKRWLAHRDKVRPDMAQGCSKRLNLGLLWYVLSFRLRALPRVEAKLEGYAGDFVWLGTPREIARFLSGERLDQHVHE